MECTSVWWILVVVAAHSWAATDDVTETSTCRRTSEGEEECGESGDQPTLTRHTCPQHLLRPNLDQEPQSWQDVKDRQVMVFSAYPEYRVKAGGPAIRVLGSGLQADFVDLGQLYCQLWYHDQEDMVPVGPAEYIRIYPSTLHPDMWVGHFILCPLPDHIPGVPYAVSITPTPCDHPRSNILLVLGQDRPTPADTFGVCISPLYNHFRNWTMVAEWLEIHKLLGADEITIYKMSASSQTQKLLDHYLNDHESRVNVVQWPFPFALKSSVWCQRAALNDCLYRMGLKHKYVAIIDLDEILVPREFATWPELLSKVDRPELGAFLFQHAYFRRNSTGEEPYLITQQSFWRTPKVEPPGKIRCKSMYKAERTVKIDLHFAYELVPGAIEYMMPPKKGMLHHYRYEPMESFRKHPERYSYIEDKYMSRYKDKLRDRVQEVINHI